ncbi:polysaccharide biosynthesis tyrosine autokinase [Rheinheimera sp.]|uniref:GumC family protein n=1 Tax=Rheinheimera sp. TaxID=1869214 RepID=UPI0027B9C795|nr:polysaccharide biosynthesis tyrosine autokinase [Rheinheimera sp.]
MSHSGQRTQTQGNDVIELSVILAILSARRWLIVFITLLVFAVVTLMVSQLPSLFRASTTLMVKGVLASNPLQSLLPGGSGDNDGLDTQIKLLTSTQFARDVVSQLPDDLQLGVPDDLRRDDAQALLAGLTVLSVPKTTLLEISFVHYNPYIASEVVNLVASRFMAYQTGLMQQHSHQASDLLSQQLSLAKTQLAQAEQKLALFRQQHQIIDIGSDVDLAKQEIVQLALEKRELNRQVQELAVLLQKISLQQDYLQLSSMPELRAIPVIASLQQQLSMLQAEFAQLKLSYLAKHPKYIAAAKKIEVSAEQLKTEVNKLTGNFNTRHAELLLLLQQTEQRAVAANHKLETLVGVAQHHKKYEAEIQASLALLTTLSDKMKETQLLKDINKTSSIIVVDPANVPSQPIGPKRLLLSVAAFLIGFIGAIFLVLCLHFFADVTAKYRQIAARFGFKLIGVVPQIRVKGIDKNLPVIQQSGKQYTLYQEYIRSIRTNILLDKTLCQQKLLAFTSIAPNEGKSSICLQLAKSFSELERVIVIDADLRFPALAEALGENPHRPGLTNLLAKTHSFDKCVFFSKELNADVLPSGIRPMNPLLFLSMPRFEAILKVLAKKYDRVIIECPPILSVSDAMVVAKCVGKLELVVDVKKTPLVDFARKLELLEQSGVALGGIILNRVKNDTSNYYATAATRAKQPSALQLMLQNNLKRA